MQDNVSQLSLPPGFRFYPTDEELLVHYLCKKVAGHHFSMQIIGEVDLYKFDPWVLPSKAVFGEKEWYFFSPRDRKYPNGSRPNRVAGSGFWKATGTDKVITTGGSVVGIKKALVFYVGKAPKGSKTNWIMHEYRLIDSSRKYSSSKLDEWVLCRIYKKKSTSALNPVSGSSCNEQSFVESSSPSSPSHLEDMLQSSPDVDEQFLTTLPRRNMNSVNLQSLGSGNFDWATLAGFNSAQAQSIMKTDVSSSDMHVLKPSNKTDEETHQSGLRIHGNAGETFGFRYPTAPGGCVFRQ